MKNRELMLNAINNFYQRSYKQNLEISELECEVILVRHPLDINELYIAEISVNVEHNALCYSITNEDSVAFFYEEDVYSIEELLDRLSKTSIDLELCEINYKLEVLENK